MKSATVIIPTISDTTVRKAIGSVTYQTYPDVASHVFIDGPEIDGFYLQEATHITELGENTGKVGEQRFWGHRIYAASPHLTNADYVFFLDDDNWYKDNHVETLIELCERENLDFAYSLRNIFDPKGKFICKDRCESLGTIPVWNDPRRGYHVDTSAYCFKRDFLIGTSWLWHGGYAQDRKFFERVRNTVVTENGLPRKVRHGTTGQFTLNYRLGSTETSASESFFTAGNQAMPADFVTKEMINV